MPIPLAQAEQLYAAITDAGLDGNIHPQSPGQADRLARAKALAFEVLTAARADHGRAGARVVAVHQATTTTPTAVDSPRSQLAAALADYEQVDPAGPRLARADALADAASRLLVSLEAADDADPGDPPLCGCGGYHWTCSADDAGQPPCDHDGGSTTYLREGGIFEDTCDTCGVVLTARSLAQIEAAMPGFAAAADRVGETSLPTPPGPRP